jgi:hypothetical protein
MAYAPWKQPDTPIRQRFLTALDALCRVDPTEGVVTYSSAASLHLPGANKEAGKEVESLTIRWPTLRRSVEFHRKELVWAHHHRRIPTAIYFRKMSEHRLYGIRNLIQLDTEAAQPFFNVGWEYHPACAPLLIDVVDNNHVGHSTIRVQHRNFVLLDEDEDTERKFRQKMNSIEVLGRTNIRPGSYWKAPIRSLRKLGRDGLFVAMQNWVFPRDLSWRVEVLPQEQDIQWASQVVVRPKLKPRKHKEVGSYARQRIKEVGMEEGRSAAAEVKVPKDAFSQWVLSPPGEVPTYTRMCVFPGPAIKRFLRETASYIEENTLGH